MRRLWNTLAIPLELDPVGLVLFYPTEARVMAVERSRLDVSMAVVLLASSLPHTRHVR